MRLGMWLRRRVDRASRHAGDDPALTEEEHPAADADRRGGGGEHAKSEQKGGVAIHARRQGYPNPETPDPGWLFVPRGTPLPIASDR